MRSDRLAPAALAAFALGSALLILLESWPARLAGVLLLFAFVVAGVFAIANPALLVDREDEEREGTP